MVEDAVLKTEETIHGVHVYYYELFYIMAVDFTQLNKNLLLDFSNVLSCAILLILEFIGTYYVHQKFEAQHCKLYFLYSCLVSYDKCFEFLVISVW